MSQDHFPPGHAVTARAMTEIVDARARAIRDAEPSKPYGRRLMQAGEEIATALGVTTRELGQYTGRYADLSGLNFETRQQVRDNIGRLTDEPVAANQQRIAELAAALSAEENYVRARVQARNAAVAGVGWARDGGDPVRNAPAERPPSPSHPPAGRNGQSGSGPGAG